MTEEERKICAELWTEYETEVRKLCIVKMNGYTNEVEDVVSEVYLALCKQVTEKGIPYFAKGWLYGTLTHIVNKKFREKYKNEKHISARRIEDIELPYQYDFVDDIVDNEMIDELNEMINALEEADQAVIHYTYTKGLKTKDIAKILGSTTAAVKQRRYRVINKLRGYMNEKHKNDD